MIGDPSFKDAERQLNTLDTVQSWSQSIKNQLSGIIDFENKENPAIVANNYEWLGELKLIDFLRDVGKNFTINYMMSKEKASNAGSNLEFHTQSSLTSYYRPTTSMN